MVLKGETADDNLRTSPEKREGGGGEDDEDFGYDGKHEMATENTAGVTMLLNGSELSLSLDSRGIARVKSFAWGKAGILQISPSD